MLKSSSLRCRFPYSQGSTIFKFPFGLDGPLLWDNTESHHLGCTFSWWRITCCLCSSVIYFIANLNIFTCSTVNGLLSGKDPWLCVCLQWTVVQWESTWSGVPTSILELKSSTGTSLSFVLKSSGPSLGWSSFNTKVQSGSPSGTLKGTAGLSLLHEGVLEATTSLYDHTAMVDLVLGASPTTWGGASLGRMMVSTWGDSSIICLDWVAILVPGQTRRLYVLADILSVTQNCLRSTSLFLSFCSLGGYCPCSAGLSGWSDQRAPRQSTWRDWFLNRVVCLF